MYERAIDPCYTSASLVVMRCPSVSLPVYLSPSYMHSVKKNKHIFKFLSPSGSHTILIFPYQISQQYSDGNPPPNGGVECTWVGRSWDSDPIIIWLNRMLWTLRRPAAINTIARRYPAIDRYLLELVLSTDGGPSSGVSQTVTVQVCLRHRKPRTSEYAEEKRRVKRT